MVESQFGKGNFILECAIYFFGGGESSPESNWDEQPKGGPECSNHCETQGAVVAHPHACSPNHQKKWEKVNYRYSVHFDSFVIS